MNSVAHALLARIKDKSANVGVIGLGYVGLPLSVAAWRAGYNLIGFDVDSGKIEDLNNGRTYLGRITDDQIASMQASGRFRATTDFGDLSQCDVIIICVPTPLNKYREPDLSYVTGTGEIIARHMREGQLITLESTTYPGTTTEILGPILTKSGLVVDETFFLAFSPEREDPGNADYHTETIPKVVGGSSETAGKLATAFYSSVVSKIVSVSDCRVAEAVKLTENIFRSVNIALVNELKIIFDRMDIDIWEVIEAAKSKPFGYMPFYPGPGLGGHCIPIDPFYLTWKAREYSVPTRFIELAGEINTAAPFQVIAKLIDALNQKSKAVNGARILIIGVAYKKNVEDTRESPSFVIIEDLESRGAIIDFYDPYVAVIPHLREHPKMSGRASLDFNPKLFATYDAVVICTDHDNIDYEALENSCELIVDTRNAIRSRTGSGVNVVLA